MVKKLSILGATGSIGVNTLNVIDYNQSEFEIQALTAQNNVELLCSQALKYQAKMIAIGNESLYKKAKELLSGSDIKITAGDEGLVEAASLGNDIVMSAIVGIAGLKPTMAAIKSGANIALANKECLVCAGNLMVNKASESDVKIIPVDSEHNAIYQIYDFDNPNQVDKIILTASGGPFRTTSIDQLQFVTKEQALLHPKWNMGAKISIDSATMMNKALEVIEACYLFDVHHQKIEIIVHPESIVHSMVSYIDGSILAQLGTTNMCNPISYALNWPRRIATTVPKLDLAKQSKLSFFEPDYIKFPVLKMVRDIIDNGMVHQIAFNGANEIAVDAFLSNKIKFTDIIKIIDQSVSKISAPPPTTIDEVLMIDKQIREIALHYIT
jgi:1-deoxy-D-xylulose-5-phosphate reductoisomerase